MLTAAEYFGGATRVSITGNLTIDKRYRIWAISTDNALRTVTLPNVLTPDLPLGSPAFIILNVGSFNFNVAGTGFTTFPLTNSPRKGLFIVGVKLSTGEFRWNYDLRNINLGS